MKKHGIKMNGYFYSILSNYKTYVDTNIFLDENTAKTWKKVLIPRLAVANKKLVVVNSVLHELKKKATDEDASLAARAKKALADVSNMVEQGLCEIEDDGVQPGLVDARLLDLFGRKRFHENLLLVTRDHSLARDILKLNGFSSAKSYREILVWSMDDDGFLDSHYSWFPKKPRPKEKATEPIESITCCDCNKSFELKRSEKNFYLKKGLCIPRRCPNCRQKKRELTNSASTPNFLKNVVGHPLTKPSKPLTDSSDSSSESSSGGGLALPGFWGTGLGDIVGAFLL